MSAREPVLAGGVRDPHGAFVSFVDDKEDANWSEHLEELHEESSRDHFLDRNTRATVVDAVRPSFRSNGTVLDAGCSSGYLLADLKSVRPDLRLVGVDLVASGLKRAKALVPSSQLLLADVCDLPVADSTIDAVVSCNLLEHVPDDRLALQEFYRVLKPGGRAAIVVPSGPGVYDYYDRFLSHERRYARHEMVEKARATGFQILRDTFLGTLIYPPFWLVKREIIEFTRIRARRRSSVLSKPISVRLLTLSSVGGRLLWSRGFWRLESICRLGSGASLFSGSHRD